MENSIISKEYLNVTDDEAEKNYLVQMKRTSDTVEHKKKEVNEIKGKHRYRSRSISKQRERHHRRKRKRSTSSSRSYSSSSNSKRKRRRNSRDRPKYRDRSRSGRRHRRSIKQKSSRKYKDSSSSSSRSRSVSYERKNSHSFSSIVPNNLQQLEDSTKQTKFPKWSSPKKTEEIKSIQFKHGKKIVDQSSLTNDLKSDTIPTVIEKEKPNFEPSGLLAKQTNTINGVTLKFTQPLDSKIPSDQWRLYTFKDNDNQDILKLEGRAYFLVGKDERVAQILVNHPSCSRQHAVIQFREKQTTDDSGRTYVEIKPYLMDLESTNGTFINKCKLEPACYYELKQEDIVNFGQSTRDYVLMKTD